MREREDGLANHLSWRPALSEANAAASGGVRAGLNLPLLAMLLAPLLWSGNFIAGRALHDLIDPLTLNFIRWLIALLLFLPFVWHEMLASWSAIRREWRLLFALGATGIAAFQTLVYLALHSTTATNALLMLSLAPIAILIAATIVGAERTTSRQLLGMFISLTGAAVLVTRGDTETIRTLGFNAGDLWMLVGVAIWAVYALLLRRRPADLPQRLTLAASMATALLLMAPLLPFADFGSGVGALTSPAVLLSIGYVATFSSIGAFLLWSYGVSQLGPTRAGQFIHLMPLYGAVLAVTILGETPTWAQLVGGALVLSGIFVVERKT
jgi:drug/metabolite transporter (DMT)-like permease